MQLCFLKILNVLDQRGYYARCQEEVLEFETLCQRGLIKRKRGTKQVFIITNKGKDYLHRLLHGRDDKITTSEFCIAVKDAYKKHSNDMMPLVKVPVIRQEIVANACISDELFNQGLLKLHDEGIITLQTSITAKEGIGGIPSQRGTYYYLTLE